MVNLGRLPACPALLRFTFVVSFSFTETIAAPARSPTRPPKQFMLWGAGWGSGLVPNSTVVDQYCFWCPRPDSNRHSFQNRILNCF